MYRVRRPSLTPEESVKLLEHARGTFLEPALYVGLFGGLRPSEIQALKWNCVELDKGLIHIREAFKKKVRRIEPFPKQKVHGVCAIPAPLHEFLALLTRTSEFVAPGIGGGMLSYETFIGTLKRFCREAGITVITPHGLRHSSTELWVMNGATLEDCSRQLNHSSSKVTETYMHRTNGRLDAIARNFQVPALPKAKAPALSLVSD